jgi:hypothetical protein
MNHTSLIRTHGRVQNKTTIKLYHIFLINLIYCILLLMISITLSMTGKTGAMIYRPKTGIK